jgi:hypothetical protein
MNKKKLSWWGKHKTKKKETLMVEEAQNKNKKFSWWGSTKRKKKEFLMVGEA